MIKNPIIFIGTGRSGTTFVSGAILSHKSLGYPSNYQHKFPENLNVNYLKRLYDNRYWRFYTRGNGKSVFHKSLFLPAEAYNMWRHLTLPRINFSQNFLLDERATLLEKEHIHNYFDKMLSVQGKNRLAFKITGPGRIGYLLSLFPDAQFVWVKRKIIPTISSFMKTTFWETRGKHKIWFKGAYSDADYEYIKTLHNHPAELTAFQIGRIIGVTEKEIKKHKAKVIEIQYEDYLKNPEKNVNNILNFTNLDYDTAPFNYVNLNGIKDNLKTDEYYYNKDNLSFLYEAYQEGLSV